MNTIKKENKDSPFIRQRYKKQNHLVKRGGFYYQNDKRITAEKKMWMDCGKEVKVLIEYSDSESDSSEDDYNYITYYCAKCYYRKSFSGAYAQMYDEQEPLMNFCYYLIITLLFFTMISFCIALEMYVKATFITLGMIYVMGQWYNQRKKKVKIKSS